VFEQLLVDLRQAAQHAEVQQLLDFLARSERGIIR
jgi:hypothetical protein